MYCSLYTLINFTTTKLSMTARAQSIARIICPQASVCAIIDILDELCNHPAVPDIFEKYPIGDTTKH